MKLFPARLRIFVVCHLLLILHLHLTCPGDNVGGRVSWGWGEGAEGLQVGEFFSGWVGGFVRTRGLLDGKVGTVGRIGWFPGVVTEELQM
eukprot:754593-Hanusia_phi.AAC.5